MSLVKKREMLVNIIDNLTENDYITVTNKLEDFMNEGMHTITIRIDKNWKLKHIEEEY